MFRGATANEFGCDSISNLPERLELGNLSVIGVGRETVHLATYSAYDPIEAPAELSFRRSPRSMARG